MEETEIKPAFILVENMVIGSQGASENIVYCKWVRLLEKVSSNFLLESGIKQFSKLIPTVT